MRVDTRASQSVGGHIPLPDSSATVTGATIGVAIDQHHGIPVVSAAGRLDASAANDLARTVDIVAACHRRPVIVNMRQLTGWTSDGAAILAQTAVDAGSRHPFAIACPPARLLAAAPALGDIAMFPSVETAIAVLTRPVGPLPHLPAGAAGTMRQAHQAFAAEAASVFAARHWTRTLLAGWGHRAHTHPVLVALSELTTHAIRHGHGDPIHVSAYTWRDGIGGQTLTVSVFDSNAHPRSPRTENTPSLGHGLGVLAELTDHVGCYQQLTAPTGKIMWFSIRLV